MNLVNSAIEFEVIFNPDTPDMLLFLPQGRFSAGPRSYSALYTPISAPIYSTIIPHIGNLSGFFKRHREIACRHIYPGHGNALIDLKERLEEIRQHQQKKKANGLDHLNAEPKTTYATQRNVRLHVFRFDKFLALN